MILFVSVYVLWMCLCKCVFLEFVGKGEGNLLEFTIIGVGILVLVGGDRM